MHLKWNLHYLNRCPFKEYFINRIDKILLLNKRSAFGNLFILIFISIILEIGKIIIVNTVVKKY